MKIMKTKKNVELLIHSAPESNGELSRKRSIIMLVRRGYPGIGNQRANQDFRLLLSPEEAEELAGDLIVIAEHVKSRDVVKA